MIGLPVWNHRFGLGPGRRSPGSKHTPHPNISGAHPQHPRERLPRIGPVPHQRLGPARLTGRAVSVKDPPTLIISLYAFGGFFAIQRSTALGY